MSKTTAVQAELEKVFGPDVEVTVTAEDEPDMYAVKVRAADEALLVEGNHALRNWQPSGRTDHD